MGSRKKYTAQQFIDAIPGTGGIIATLASRIGCKWDTAKSYIYDYPTVQAAYDNECEMVNDKAESVIISDINNGSVESSKWWVSRKRKDKFSTREEVTGVDGADIHIKVTYEFDGNAKKSA